MLSPLSEIYSAIIEGDRRAVAENVQLALDAGIDSATILKEGMMAAMDEVGRRFESGDYYVPEMLISARAMKTGLQLLHPTLAPSQTCLAGKVLIGTVKGDLHDIGKNLVALMLEGAGFCVQDLGTDVPPEKFTAAVQADTPDIVALSALLTTTMPAMEATIQSLKNAGMREKIKVIIGGAPTSQAYAEKIGADGYSADAAQSVELARALVRPSSKPAEPAASLEFAEPLEGTNLKAAR